MPSLAERLTWLAESIGGDVGLLERQREDHLAVPQLFLRGSAGLSAFAAGSVYWLTAESGGLVAPNTDTQLAVIARDLPIADFDIVEGYVPQMRLKTSLASNGTDPGSQTFTMGVSGLIHIPGAGASSGGSSNRRYSLGGTLVNNVEVNLAAAEARHKVSGWMDITALNYSNGGLASTKICVYTHLTATVAVNSFLTLEWTIELRYVPIVPIP